MLANQNQSTSKSTGVVIIAIIFFIAGFFTGSLWRENKILKSGAAPQKQAAQPTDVAGEKADTLNKMPAISEQDHIRGGENPKIYLVEYSDYECPFCEKFHPTTKQVLEKYGDQVAFVYRHYPLSFHPNAQAAAEAAECIADKSGNDAFWKYTDEVFVQNKQLGGKISPEAIDIAIQASGADIDAIKNCMDSGEMTAIVTAQQSGGAAAGITGTPGTIIVTTDGQYELLTGALPLVQVEQAIDKYL